MPHPPPLSCPLSLRRLGATLLAAGILLLCTLPLSAAPEDPGSLDRIRLRLDGGEAEAVLAILEKVGAGEQVREEDWRRLFESEPYVRLKKREAAMNRPFSDADFRKFVLGKELASRASELRRTLEAWKRSDLTASAKRVLAYLPQEAVIRAGVFPVIKPQTNSFVFEPSTDAAIFLYLDPAESAVKFGNTVAHELHHIGFASLSGMQEERLKRLAPEVKTALDWMGAFGEGFAMLAAAGGPDVHPHTSSPPEDRARWDRDMGRFNRDLRQVEKFFMDILSGRLKTEEEISKAGFSFFGVQGPWYTVGYRMAVVVERRHGRAILIECMREPRELLSRYNTAAAELNRADGGERLVLWSPELLAKLGAGK